MIVYSIIIEDDADDSPREFRGHYRHPADAAFGAMRTDDEWCRHSPATMMRQARRQGTPAIGQDVKITVVPLAQSRRRNTGGCKRVA